MDPGKRAFDTIAEVVADMARRGAVEGEDDSGAEEAAVLEQLEKRMPVRPMDPGKRAFDSIAEALADVARRGAVDEEDDSGVEEAAVLEQLENNKRKDEDDIAEAEKMFERSDDQVKRATYDSAANLVAQAFQKRGTAADKRNDQETVAQMVAKRTHGETPAEEAASEEETAEEEEERSEEEEENSEEEEENSEEEEERSMFNMAAAMDAIKRGWYDALEKRGDDGSSEESEETPASEETVVETPGEEDSSSSEETVVETPGDEEKRGKALLEEFETMKRRWREALQLKQEKREEAEEANVQLESVKRAFNELIDSYTEKRSIIKCVNFGEPCTGTAIKPCCDPYKCHKEKYFTKGTCQMCKGVNSLCWKDSECCLGLDCSGFVKRRCKPEKK